MMDALTNQAPKTAGGFAVRYFHVLVLVFVCGRRLGGRVDLSFAGVCFPGVFFAALGVLDQQRMPGRQQRDAAPLDSGGAVGTPADLPPPIVIGADRGHWVCGDSKLRPVVSVPIPAPHQRGRLHRAGSLRVRADDPARHARDHRPHVFNLCVSEKPYLSLRPRVLLGRDVLLLVLARLGNGVGWGFSPCS